MRFVTLAFFAAYLTGTITARHTIETFAGETTGGYIVTLKPGVPKASFLTRITYKSTITHPDWDIINGFAGHFHEDVLSVLRVDPDVESIAEDGIIHRMSTQTNAPWGLSRLSSTTRLTNTNAGSLTFTYNYDPSGGAGVDIFIIDTGIFTAHSDFGGHASWGETFGPYPDVDDNGHGTYCAGIAAGHQFGVAKSANLVAVKVLGAAGSGTISDIIAGLNFILQQHQATGRPTVASLAIGGAASTSLDNAVAALTNGGVHVVVPAGNDNSDASSTSPARAPSAITVGASTILDARASFSNFGSVVDIFAPGQNIISDWITPGVTMNLSGTSMSACHVAGVVAYLIGLYGDMSPSAMSDLLKSLCLKGVLTGIPSGTSNCLVHIPQSPV